MILFADIVSIFDENMIGGLTHELDVSLKGEDPHILYIACKNGSMTEDMAATATYFLPFEVGHEFDGDDHPLYVYGKVSNHPLLVHSPTYYSLVEVMIFVAYFPCYFLQLHSMRIHCILVRHCLYLSALGKP